MHFLLDDFSFWLSVSKQKMLGMYLINYFMRINYGHWRAYPNFFEIHLPRATRFFDALNWQNFRNVILTNQYFTVCNNQIDQKLLIWLMNPNRGRAGRGALTETYYPKALARFCPKKNTLSLKTLAEEAVIKVLVQSELFHGARNCRMKKGLRRYLNEWIPLQIQVQRPTKMSTILLYSFMISSIS